MQCLGGSPGHCTSQHRPAPALHMLSFENFVKSMPPSLSELNVTPSFCFAFKIPDDVTASNKYLYNYFFIFPILVVTKRFLIWMMTILSNHHMKQLWTNQWWKKQEKCRMWMKDFLVWQLCPKVIYQGVLTTVWVRGRRDLGAEYLVFCKSKHRWLCAQKIYKLRQTKLSQFIYFSLVFREQEKT